MMDDAAVTGKAHLSSYGIIVTIYRGVSASSDWTEINFGLALTQCLLEELPTTFLTLLVIWGFPLDVNAFGASAAVQLHH